jgi:16S rRNA (uracil1498-N3)-methyltransferase
MRTTAQPAASSSCLLVNIILFSPAEVQLPLPRGDFRARHIVEVLRRKPGDTFDAGLLNGPRGKATFLAARENFLDLSFVWGEPPTPLSPIRLLVGLPRPQTARDVLREGATLGVTAMDFVRTDRGEPSYAQSTLWSSREWETLLIAGAAQAFCTRLPELRHGHSLAEAIASLPESCTRIALDNYESPGALGQVALRPDASVVLALGAERGWSPAERDLLLRHGFLFAHLGERVLRTETACIAAIAVIKTKLGLL